MQKYRIIIQTDHLQSMWKNRSVLSTYKLQSGAESPVLKQGIWIAGSMIRELVSPMLCGMAKSKPRQTEKQVQEGKRQLEQGKKEDTKAEVFQM